MVSTELAAQLNTEVSLDIEMAISMATNLSKVIVYEAPISLPLSTSSDLLNRMASDNPAKQISSSWIIGDNASYDTAYQQMAVQGQSFFQASGDNGAYYTSNINLQQSADDTNITLVGGTTLSTTGAGGAYSSETVWNQYATGLGTLGSGGGTNFNGVPIPIWQTGINMTTNLGSTTLRNVPDVAMTADNIVVVANNGQQENDVNGTSCAAPLWAGFCALVNQQATNTLKPPVGFLNPALYAIGKGPNYAVAFHDITAGNNTNAAVHDKYFAVPGYDLCTGWGTPNGQNLINALIPPDPLGIVPAGGFYATGPASGPFSPTSQIFFLTNTGASSLAWSLIKTSAWLNVSTTSGTLAAGASNSVTVSLATAAYSLAVGTYTSTMKLTNWNTHVVQSLLFTLQAQQPLTVAPATGFTAAGTGYRSVQSNLGKFPVDQHRQRFADLVAHQHLRLAHGIGRRRAGRERQHHGDDQLEFDRHESGCWNLHRQRMVHQQDQRRRVKPVVHLAGEPAVDSKWRI